MERLTPAFNVENLSFSYREALVLSDVQIEIAQGKLLFILGRNGSGKSTCLRLLAGLLPCRVGVIQVFGRDLKDIPMAERAKMFGFLNQQHQAVFPFTVEDVVLTGRASYAGFSPKKADFEVVRETLEKMEIGYLRNRIYSELSGGEQQLVMLARVLAQQPRILLLDEPTSQLDFHHQSYLFSLLRTFANAGLTVVSVLHDPNLAFLFGDDFLFVKEGTIFRPPNGIEPWDAGFLNEIYPCEFQSVPFNDRAVVFPKITL